MESRIKKDPKRIFDCFLEIASPQNGVDGWILQSFPASYKTKEADKLKSVPHFAFPCPLEVTTVQHFSFVMTNLESLYTFGFCRYAPRAETALVILSPLPWHELFYKLLNKCAELTQHGETGDLERFLEAVHTAKVPLSGLVFQINYGSGNIFTSPTPDLLRLPSIPENRNLTEYFNAVDVQNMLILFASMLYERRIVITSKKLSRLSACVQASNAIIYPMEWQHIYIPVMPTQLLDYLTAPMPFLIGVPETLMKSVRRSELGDAVILDADNNRVETPHDDLETLPTEVVSNLRRALKSPTQMLGDNVARAFLQALVHLIGGYRDALRYRQGEKITFSEDAFVCSRSSALQPFLEQMLQLQLFRQFIEDRLKLLNSGQGFSDEFELECVAFTEKNNNKLRNQYTSFKKEGGAIVKGIKNKANPAMKAVVHSVKDGTKGARDKMKDSSKQAKSKAKASYKDVKNKLKDNPNRDLSREDSSSTQSAPSSPTLSRGATLPRQPVSVSSSPAPGLTRNNTDLNFGTNRVLKYERFDPSEEIQERNFSPEFEELPKLEYNLMNDLDEVMLRNRSESNLPAPPIHRALKPTAGTLHRFSTSDSVPNLAAYQGRLSKPTHTPPSVEPRKPSTSSSDSLDNSTPIPHPRLHRKGPDSRKSSLGDLIKLETAQDGLFRVETAQDDTEFDPLKMKSNNSNVAFNPTYEQVLPGGTFQKKPLERSNPFAGPAKNGHHGSAPHIPSNPPPVPPTNLSNQTHRTPPTNYNTGKYENYVPPGGKNAPQFKQFLSSMTETQGNNLGKSSEMSSRSSDDLLNEYGLDFNAINFNSQSNPSQMFATPLQQNINNVPRPNPVPSNPNLHHLNGNNRNSSFLYTSPSTTAFVSRQSQNLPNSQVMPVNQSLMMPVNQKLSWGQQNQSPYPTPNSSFLVNTNSLSQPQMSCRDILADLDPLRSATASTAVHHAEQGNYDANKQSVPIVPIPMGGSGQAAIQQPPSVPRRNKKQWTTFE